MGLFIVPEKEEAGYTQAPKRGFRPLAWIIAILGVMGALNILFPGAVSFVLNILWIFLLTIVSIFFVLGVLVVIGLKKEASKLLDVLLEGSLTFLDIVEFIKLVYRKFIEVLKAFMIYIAPVLAYILALILYVSLIVLYKKIGSTYDITVFTILLTTLLVLFSGLINKPGRAAPDLSLWKNQFNFIFHKAFVDGFEVVLFVFFLTMDSTGLFFLPKELNVALKAQIGDYDFMMRSYHIYNHFKVTLNIILYAIGFDILRHILKLITAGRVHYYTDYPEMVALGYGSNKVERIKSALRKTFKDSKDHLVRFITFSTVLFGVFLLFPRLKLMALLVTAITNLFLDIVIPSRRKLSKGQDLISRILTLLFKV